MTLPARPGRALMPHLYENGTPLNLVALDCFAQVALSGLQSMLAIFVER